jgi:hypothetical protein
VSRKNSRVPDVPRLLALKHQVRESILGEETASSVSAFIAWKALLLASQAEVGGSEIARLKATVVECLRRYPKELRPALTSFVVALTRVSGPDVTPSVKSEWMGDPGELAGEVDRVLRSVKQLSRRLPETPDDRLWTLAEEVALRLRQIRHVVIGHARVTTGTPLFATIVKPFEELVTQLADLQHRILNA